MVDVDRLAMPVGEAMFTQRSIRRLKTDPIPMEDIRLIVEAAVKAPNGGNSQPTRILVLTDQDKIREFGPTLQGGLVGEAGRSGLEDVRRSAEGQLVIPQRGTVRRGHQGCALHHLRVRRGLERRRRCRWCRPPRT